jgi:hypothetical protein
MEGKKRDKGTLRSAPAIFAEAYRQATAAAAQVKRIADKEVYDE